MAGVLWKNTSIGNKLIEVDDSISNNNLVTEEEQAIDTIEYTLVVELT